MIARPPSVLEVAELVAERADARYQLNGWLGVPSRKAHRMADQFMGRIQDLEADLTPDVVLDWSRRP